MRAGGGAYFALDKQIETVLRGFSRVARRRFGRKQGDVIARRGFRKPGWSRLLHRFGWRGIDEIPHLWRGFGAHAFRAHQIFDGTFREGIAGLLRLLAQVFADLFPNFLRGRQ